MQTELRTPHTALKRDCRLSNLRPAPRNPSRPKSLPVSGWTLRRPGSLWLFGLSRRGLAGQPRAERMHGDVTYFNVNRHINPTNVCVAACKLCAFDAKGPRNDGLEEAFDALRLFRAVTSSHRRRLASRTCPSNTSSISSPASSSASLKSTSRPSPWLRSVLARRAKLSIEETLIKMREAAWIPCRRRRGDLCCTGSQHHLRPQDRRLGVARHRAPGSQARLQVQRHDALRHIENDEDASTTCSSCVKCRTRRAASRPSSRSRFTRKTRRSTLP